MARPLGRRLHTLAGAVVLGAFLVEHLLTNASILGGAASFDHVVGSIQRWPWVGVFEVVFILVPLAFHALVGLRMLARGAADAEIDRYGDRRLWVVGRASAVVTFAFVTGHFFELRAQRLFFGGGPEATYTILTEHLSRTWFGIPWVAVLYVIGIAATCFHFATGVFAASALRGWATSRMRLLTFLVGGGLFLIGFLTVLAFATGTRLSNPPEGESIPCGSAVPIGSSKP